MPDVVIVGAGPAGSATAIHLARRGRSVLLLDRAAFPRRKPCGEGLFPRGVRELRDLGVLDHIDGAVVLQSLRFCGYGETAEAGLGTADAPALGVARAVLDHALLEQARAHGVEVRLGVRPAQLEASEDAFTVVADKRHIDARMIVAADGLGSRLRKEAGLEARGRGARYGITAHVELRRPAEPAVDVHFWPGYEVYVTPVGGRWVNVAVLMAKPLTQVLSGHPDGALEELLYRVRCLPPGWRLSDSPQAAGPFPVRAKRLWRRNLVLAGDAAGFFDGITGEGMSLALASARDCAEAVDGYLDSGDARHFRRYAGRRRSLARNSELLGRLTLFLAQRPRLAARAIRGLGKRPDSFSRLLAISSGEARLRSVRPADLVAPFLG